MDAAQSAVGDTHRTRGQSCRGRRRPPTRAPPRARLAAACPRAPATPGCSGAACPSPHRTPWLSELPCPKRSFLVAVKCVFPVQSLKILSPHPLRCSAPPRVRGAPRVVWAASFCTMARGVTCSARVTPVCAVPLSGRFKQYFQDTHEDTPFL